MITNEHGIVAASRDELMAIWVYDDDLFKLFEFPEWVGWCDIIGIKIT